MPGARDLVGVVVPLDGGGVEGEEGAGLDVFGRRPVIDEACNGALDCFCGFGEN